MPRCEPRVLGVGPGEEGKRACHWKAPPKYKWLLPSPQDRSARGHAASVPHAPGQGSVGIGRRVLNTRLSEPPAYSAPVWRVGGVHCPPLILSLEREPDGAWNVFLTSQFLARWQVYNRSLMKDSWTDK